MDTNNAHDDCRPDSPTSSFSQLPTLAAAAINLCSKSSSSSSATKSTKLTAVVAEPSKSKAASQKQEASEQLREKKTKRKSKSSNSTSKPYRRKRLKKIESDDEDDEDFVVSDSYEKEDDEDTPNPTIQSVFADNDLFDSEQTNDTAKTRVNGGYSSCGSETLSNKPLPKPANMTMLEVKKKFDLSMHTRIKFCPLSNLSFFLIRNTLSLNAGASRPDVTKDVAPSTFAKKEFSNQVKQAARGIQSVNITEAYQNKDTSRPITSNSTSDTNKANGGNGTPESTMKSLKSSKKVVGKSMQSAEKEKAQTEDKKSASFSSPMISRNSESSNDLPDLNL